MADDWDEETLGLARPSAGRNDRVLSFMNRADCRLLVPTYMGYRKYALDVRVNDTVVCKAIKGGTIPEGSRKTYIRSLHQW